MALTISSCAGISVANHVPSSNIEENNYLIIDQSKLASTSKLVLDKKYQTDWYAFSAPSGWDVSLDDQETSGDHLPVAYFRQKNNTDIMGGIYVEEYTAQPGETMPGVDFLLERWMVSNHSKIDSMERLTGFFTDAYLLKITTSAPAASGTEKADENWTYIDFIDKAKTTETKFVAYQLYFKSAVASEADAVKVAGSFKLRTE